MEKNHAPIKLKRRKLFSFSTVATTGKKGLDETTITTVSILMTR